MVFLVKIKMLDMLNSRFFLFVSYLGKIVIGSFFFVDIFCFKWSNIVLF